MPQKTSEWVDIPAKDSEWEDIPANDDKWETIPSVPSRAQGPGPLVTQETKPPGPSIHAYEPSLLERAKGELHDAYTESRMPHLPDIPWITKPPEFISKGAQSISDYLTTPTAKQNEHPVAARVKGFLGGAAEGAAGQATGLNVGLALAGQGEVSALRSATTLAKLGKTAEAAQAFNTARKLELATRAVSVPLGYESLATATDPNATTLERVSAIPGLAGAALGMRGRVREIAAHTPAPTVEQATRGPHETIDLTQSKEGTFTAPKVPSETNLTKPVATPVEPETKPVVRPNTLTIKMGPKTVENMQKMIGEGYRVKSANAEEVVLTKEPEITPNPETEPLFSKVKGGLDEKTAIIEDERPKWEGVGPNGEDYYAVGTPTQSGEAGEWFLSHGILDPETEVKLQSQGFKLVKRSEMGNQEHIPVSEEESAPNFGIPTDRLFEADKNVSDTRMNELTQKFADMATQRLPPETNVSELRRQELLNKLGGRSPEEDISLTQPLKSRAVDENGQPIQTKEFTPEELAVRKKQIATDWYNARKEAKELGIDHNKYRDINELRAAIVANKPQLARTESGRAKIGVNVARSAQELTTGYSGPLPGIMVREGLQNAFDAMKAVGGGDVTIRVLKGKPGDVTGVEGPSRIEIHDRGKGMTRHELETVFSNLHESGKINQAGATGGKGVGKASYMLGGQHFKVESVVSEGGKKLLNTFQGTPEELMEGFDINTTEVPKDTPTGTRILTQLAEGQDRYSATNMVNKIQKYSREVPVKLTTNLYGSDYEPAKMKTFKDDNFIGEGMVGNNKIGVYIPKNTKTNRSSYLDLRILNNGMYQYDHTMYLGEEIDGLPDTILIDVKPQMEEGAPDYPFPVQRESVKDNVRQGIEQLVKDSIINPMTRKKGMELSTFWNNLPEFPIQGTMRDTLLFDTGSRLTANEHIEFLNSHTLQQITSQIDGLIDDILTAANPGQKIRPGEEGQPPEILEHDWYKKVKKTGIILDPQVHGIHIPDPSTKGATSAILINPFESANRLSPERAAVNIVVTALHEVAHVGKTVNPIGPELLPEDLSDPRVGQFLQTYLQEVKGQGGLDLGHGMDFVKRLGDVYARFGSNFFWQHADAIRDAISDGVNAAFNPHEPRRYSPEFQRLLHVYNESRGRDETKADILSRTGIKSAIKGSGKNPVSGNSNPNGDGVTRLTLKGLGPESKLSSKEQKNVRKTAMEMGLMPTGFSDKAGNPIWQKPKDENISKFNELWNLPRGLMSVDLPFITSAAMRQGLPLIGPNFSGWIKAWADSARAYSSKVAAAKVTDQIAASPIFRRGRDANGAVTPSFAEQIGLDMTDTQTLSGREEALKSKWSERIPLWGRHVAASNRAFTAFMNSLRASSATRFLHQASEDSLMYKLTGGRVGTEGRDPTENIALAKEIASAVNVLSGRGKLDVQITPETRFTKGRTYSAENAAKLLTDVFFAPRLVASRVKMLNPNTYLSADPFARKLYIKGVLGAIATWWTIASLIEASGGEVSKDPNDADFGKGRIGNTRIDPGAGFQQFLVLGSRIRPEWLKNPVPVPFPPYGEPVEDPGGQLFTSSTSGKTRHLGQGFRPITSGELAQNFVRSKLHPTTALIVDMLYATQDRKVFVGDRAIQMVAPMMAGDLLQVMQEDPSLAPLVLGSTNMGMGGSSYSGGPTKPTFTPALDQLTGIPFSEYDPTIGGR